MFFFLNLYQLVVDSILKICIEMDELIRILIVKYVLRNP